MKKYLFITIFVALLMQMKSQTVNRFDELKSRFEESEIVFEGHFVKKNPSFLTKRKEVFTMFDFKVTKMIKGTMPKDSIIKIETDGGSVIDPETGLTQEGFNSHGNGLIPSSNAIIFLYPKNERGNNRVREMIDVSNPEKIRYNDIEGYNPQPYNKKDELYNDINKIAGSALKVEKKNALNGAKELSDLPTINYFEKKANFDKIIALKTQLAKSVSAFSKTTIVNDLTLQIANPVISGSIFQFDINVKADNNSTYLDNAPVWISYNSAVFGSSVVAANNVTVTNGTNFNNANYYPANSYMTDNSASTFAFAMSAIFSNPVRTNITTSYQFLARVKMNILNCGNVNVDLTNASTALNACFYAPTATSSTILNYNSLLYNGGPLTNNITVCPAIIKDFTSPVNGGLNQILTIKGFKFGAVRGNGQVKFRGADNFGHPYLNKLDNVDYISWNDTMIQIKMPSTLDTLNPNAANTPGSGNFKVVTNAGDSVTSALNSSSLPFTVYYSIYAFRPSASSGLTQAQKNKANLYKSVQSTGGYVVRLDTSVGNDPLKKMCVKKAIREWDCLTSVNIQLGTDTAFSGYGISDKICNIVFVDPNAMSASNVVAETRCNANLVCPTNPPQRVINDFDIKINKAYLPKFFYDTTGSTLPAFKIDFLEVIEHEMGHGIGLMHVNDSSAMMYYRTLGNLSTSIPGSQRRKLTVFTSDVDGGTAQVSTSQTNVTGACGFQDMVLLNLSNCNPQQGLHELASNDFNLSVYPNPTIDGHIFISFDVYENLKPVLEITDILGKVIQSETLNNGYNNHYTHEMNLSSLSKGIYILKIKQNNIISSFKLVKQ